MEAWVASAALGLLAVVGLLALARRPGRGHEPETSRELFAARRRELVDETGVAGLGEEDAAALATELALDHLDDTEQGDSAANAQPPERAPLVPLLVGAALALVGALVLYGLWGEPQAPLLAEAEAIMRDSDPVAMKRLERALESRLARQPEDVNARFVLGHLNMQLEDYPGAVDAFAELHARAGPINEVDLAWAQAGYRADGGRITPATREVIDRVLAARPDHPSVLELLAMDAIHRRDLAAAAGFLDRALRQPMPAAHRALLAATLAVVRQRVPRDEETEFSEPKAALSVSVSLDESFEADALVPVFVIARDPDAPRPPLAVRRLTVGDLPAEIQLTDADTMLGGALSTLDTVELLARASLSGSPSARSGDLESDLATVSPGGVPVALHIHNRVP